ncbi:hypothetical protein A2686_04595 [Candidatus Woesebacteria bacterium RIFCSPHIGHO2_01_FULL_38_10]|uniref:Amine oxidase domain-containing protein n=1 Tax=Candidatus Woesebacteria bacterium RIFCSPLOWO2_01_FULL_39_10b TaxID=1802517 RepID=A0A1F8B9C1_9BACT|nr:MAG: hypothetical protein A2686_04595 [Candidatus Woesebacteria bacterium RIFCSPHIGHO2_01_FULL_38_10]OGM60617.1 MAG: hypothetical protein A2892_01055 [Candidatus Woesebacteria bacterium RIFCSPLOWO2_01_FULL_39_10b]
MKVGIIGAGFVGLAAGYRLAKAGFNVNIFESEGTPGGLAQGFKEPEWKWSLEKHYHHLFKSDRHISNLAEEVGQEIDFRKVKTSTFIKGNSYQLDSLLTLLSFPKLTITDRLRTGLILAYLRFTSDWKSLEKISSKEFLIKFMGKKSWEILWKPLFEKKFDCYADQIPASWFWARLKVRSRQLGYPESGFLSFAKHLDRLIHYNKGRIFYKTRIESIKKVKDKLILGSSKESYEFDAVICTLCSQLFIRIAKDLPSNYIKSLMALEGIGAVTLLVSLNRKYLTDDTYWLNVSEAHFPFLAIVEHTNFIDKVNYNDEHLVYIGNYLPYGHRYFSKDAVEIFREFFPYLKTINPKFDKSWVNKLYLFKTPFAQPVVTLNYSQNLPTFKTPVKGLYLCNIQQVYPWDRGTNYAVELGENVTDLVLKS